MKKIAEIQETTISRGVNGTVVQIQLADAPEDDPHATFRMQLLATLPSYDTPLLAQLQYAALEQAHQIIAAQLDVLRPAAKN